MILLQFYYALSFTIKIFIFHFLFLVMRQEQILDINIIIFINDLDNELILFSHVY